MTEKDIIKIIQEEKIRNLINKEGKKESSAFWKFLNSVLGIWFLSTIGVGLITLGYTKIQFHFQQKLEKEQMIEKLDLEIESRLYQFEYKAKRNSDSLKINQKNIDNFDFQNTQGLNIKEYWFQLKQPPINSYLGYYSVYPEFENRNLVSLLFELNSFVKTENEKIKINEIIKKIISDKVLPIQNIEVNKESIEEVLLQLRNNRWRKIWSD